MFPRRRSVLAAETIVSFAKRGQKAPPVAFLEAVALSAPGERAGALEVATVALAECSDPGGAVGQIVDAYLSELPVGRDAAELPQLDGNAKVAAPTPGGDACGIGGDGMAMKFARQDDRRTIDDCVMAVDVICEAALRRYELREPAIAAAASVVKLAKKARGHLGVLLAVMAQKLKQSGRAAGTKEPPEMRGAEKELVARAVAGGASSAEAAAVARFSRDYDELRRHGIEPNQSRTDFVRVLVRDWKAKQA